MVSHINNLSHILHVITKSLSSGAHQMKLITRSIWSKISNIIVQRLSFRCLTLAFECLQIHVLLVSTWIRSILVRTRINWSRLILFLHLPQIFILKQELLSFFIWWNWKIKLLSISTSLRTSFDLGIHVCVVVGVSDRTLRELLCFCVLSVFFQHLRVTHLVRWFLNLTININHWVIYICWVLVLLRARGSSTTLSQCNSSLICGWCASDLLDIRTFILLRSTSTSILLLHLHLLSILLLRWSEIEVVNYISYILDICHSVSILSCIRICLIRLIIHLLEFSLDWGRLSLTHLLLAFFILVNKTLRYFLLRLIQTACWLKPFVVVAIITRVSLINKWWITTLTVISHLNWIFL